MSEIANLLRDPLWQFIGVIITIVGVATAIFFSVRQRNHKALSYRIISSAPVLSVSEGVEGKLKILYENREVQQVQLIVISITNTGNLPIIENDYSHPLEISFGNAKLLTVEVMEKSPKELDITASVRDDMVVINKGLLNQGDNFVFRILVADFSNTIKVMGRVVGIKSITKEVEPTSVRNAFIGLILLYGGLFSSIANDNSLKNGSLTILSVLIMIFGGIIVTWYGLKRFLYLRGIRRKKK